MRKRLSGSGRKTRTRGSRTRWSLVLSWSMLAATAAHAAVFALGPVWKVSDSIVHDGSGMTSIEPIIVPGARLSTGPGSATRTSSTEAFQPDPAERDAASVPGSVDEREPIEFPPASIVDLLPARAKLSASPRLAPMVLEHQSPPNTHIGSMTPAGVWRDIRNPGELLQFLQERYNPVLEVTGARGYATIAVWIDMRGRVVHSEIHDSSGEEALDEIALELMNEIASFKPSRTAGGRPLTMELITIPFTMAW